MKFVAEKGDKKKIIMIEGNYLVEKNEFPNPTQVMMAWKRRKNELHKAGYQIHVINTDTKKVKEEKPSDLDLKKGEERKLKKVRLFGYEAFVEEN